MIHRFLLLSLLFFVISCQPDYSSEPQAVLDNLPTVKPQSLIDIEQVEDFYFDHLNYSTVSLENGNVIINDRPLGIILEISPEGELVRQIARQGRGPGEIQDASALNADPNENLVIFDQSNQKVVQYFSDGSSPNQFLPFQPDQYRIRSAYALNDIDKFLIVKWNPSALQDPDGEIVNRFVIYNRASDEILADQIYPDRIIARQIFDGVVRGGIPVPYAPEFYFALSNDKSSIYTGWTETNEIAELNLTLDTLRTIDVPLQTQSLTRAEIDSLEQTFDDRRINPWGEIQPLLPEQKASYDDLMVDHLDRIWLKLTRQSEWQDWLILSNDGTPQKIVQLPKEGMLTHVSEHHLGFRENDFTFSLYEAVD